jgi:mannose-binding lectin 2
MLTVRYTDNHDIISVTAKNLYSSNPNRPGPGRSNKPRKSTKTPKGYNSERESSGGWGWFFLKSLMFVVVCAGGYVGWVAYRTQKRSSRF